MTINESSAPTEFPQVFDGYFLTKALSVIINNIGFIFKLTLGTALILTIIQKSVSQSLFISYFGESFDPAAAEPRDLVLLIPIMYLRKIIELLPETMLIMVFISALPKMYENVELNLSESLKLNFAKWFQLYVYSIAIAAIVYLGLIMFIVPGIIAMIQFTFVQFVIVMEENVKVLPRSFQLIKGYQWKVMSIYMIKITVLFLLVIFPVLFLVGQNSEGLSDVNQSELGFISALLINLLMMITVVIMVTMFFQLYMMVRIANNEIEVVQT